MEVATTANLDQFETKALLELESRVTGIYTRKMMIRGNSLLSSVFIKAATPGATLQVNYFDTSTGDENSPERFNLQNHIILTDAEVGSTSRLIVTRFHNKPQIEAIVTGGSVEFGVYVTVVTDFPVELTGQLLNGQAADLTIHGGLPPAIYDPSEDKFFLLRGSGGVLSTGSALSSPAVHNVVIAAADVEQSFTFPANTRRFVIKPRGHGKIRLAHIATESASNYLTIWPGAFYCSPEFAASAKTIYFQSPVEGLSIEMESWS